MSESEEHYYFALWNGTTPCWDHEARIKKGLYKLFVPFHGDIMGNFQDTIGLREPERA